MIVVDAKRSYNWAFIIPTFLTFFGILFGAYSSYGRCEDIRGLNLDNSPDFIVAQGNSLISISNPANPPRKVVRKLPVVVTAYSSTPWQTDDTPHITAAGTFVREGIVANNLLSFGTEIRMPELYDDRVFVVEDRMNWKKGNNHIDVWFPDYGEAIVFGAKMTYIEILER